MRAVRKITEVIIGLINAGCFFLNSPHTLETTFMDYVFKTFTVPYFGVNDLQVQPVN